MTEAEAKVVPYLFMVLFGLIGVNLLINASLYYVSKIKNIKVLFWYWLVLLLTFLVQGQFQTDEMSIMLSFGVTIVPDLIIVKVLNDSMDVKLPLRRNLVIWALGMLTSFVLKTMGLPFAQAALPMCLTLCAIICEPSFEALVKRRKTSSIHQKFIAIIIIAGAIHSINFALFRLVPGAQIWGWSVSLGFYQILSITLFAFAFEDYSSREKQRLQELVKVRTEELSRTLQLKDTLFKVVLHDIANPIQGQLWIMSKYKRDKELSSVSLDRLFRLTSMIKEVIGQVRSSEEAKSGSLNLELRPVILAQCLEDLHLIFEGPLNDKGLTLDIHNELPEGTTFMADQNAFTTSVMCNLVSNAIKFSPPDSILVIRSFLKGGKIVIEVEDRGIGMPKEMALGIFDLTKKKSRPGTLGEKGTGYGLPLVKSFVDHFGGDIEFESRAMDIHPLDHGTKVTLTLDQTLGH